MLLYAGDMDVSENKILMTSSIAGSTATLPPGPCLTTYGTGSNYFDLFPVYRTYVNVT